MSGAMSQETFTQPSAAIRGLVPMIHVQDVERSAAFYQLLGFEIGNRVPRSGPMGWAWLYSRHAADWKIGPNLMLTRAEGRIDASEQVLFYLYASDLKNLRGALVMQGVTATDISHLEYLPAGECRVQDPDGYTVMIAQSTSETP
jgi:catechol 2,3-dioxygenase-like lactoylglutathione lyase family enzyme